MMRYALLTASVLLQQFWVEDAAAQRDDVILVCSYEQSYDIRKEQTAAISGSVVLQISFINERDIIVAQSGLGAKYAGSETNGEILATTEYEMNDGFKVKRMLVVNRYTGEFSLVMAAGQGEFVKSGRCKRQDKALF